MPLTVMTPWSVTLRLSASGRSNATHDRTTFAASNRSERASPPRSGSMRQTDRKSTRLNSSHTVISYAVFCLKKKKKKDNKITDISEIIPILLYIHHDH